jgi:hypothetical protein
MTLVCQGLRQIAAELPKVIFMKQISEVEEKQFTVHVVFKYLSTSLLLKGVGMGGVTPLPPLTTTLLPTVFHLKTT